LKKIGQVLQIAYW